MQQLVSIFSLAQSSMWPKGEREASSLLRLLITISESPSRIKDEKPSSSATEMARAAAKASTMSDVCGRGTLIMSSFGGKACSSHSHMPLKCALVKK